MVEGLEMTCFQIISNVGAARSSYIEGIQKAKAGDFEGARKCIEEGQKLFLVGHEAHFELIQKEAQGVQVGGSLILVHAEDQLMSAESFKIIAEEMIASYERIIELEKKLAVPIFLSRGCRCSGRPGGGNLPPIKRKGFHRGYRHCHWFPYRSRHRLPGFLGR